MTAISKEKHKSTSLSYWRKKRSEKLKDIKTYQTELEKQLTYKSNPKIGRKLTRKSIIIAAQGRASGLIHHAS